MKALFCKIRLASLFLFLLTAAAANGQKAADVLFNEGKALQAEKKYKGAKDKFKAAKSLYLAAKNEERAKTCDMEIANCPPPGNKRKKNGNPQQRDNAGEEVKPIQITETHKDVSLKLSKERLDFDYKPKKGATQSVEVDCNYDDWKADSDKEWVSIYIAEKKFTVEVAENTTEEERSCVVKVMCGDKSVDLVINQKKATQFNKLTNTIGGIFKKKKVNRNE